MDPYFWERGYLVSTVGRDDAVIREYSRNQEVEFERLDRLNLWNCSATEKVAQFNRGRVSDPDQDAALSGSGRKVSGSESEYLHRSNQVMAIPAGQMTERAFALCPKPFCTQRCYGSTHSPPAIRRQVQVPFLWVDP